MMNLQQVMPPKSTVNGFGHRKVEREGGTRQESKLQSGKSNSARVASTGAPSAAKFGGFESPARDRLLYATTSLVGLPVEVHVKNGSIYSGIFHAPSEEKDGREFGVILKMARLVKDGMRGQKTIAGTVSKAPSKIFIIPADELVQVIAKDVAVTRDGLANDLQGDKPHELMIDSFISQSRHMEMGRELEPWIPDEDDPQLPELENIFDDPWNRNWDQFETNETLFGVKTTFDEELYTTKLLRGPETRELEREAMRIAREIEGEDTQDLHLAEERGVNLNENFDIDEETRYSSVCRSNANAFDDSGYEDDEDILLNSRIDETFGGSSVSVSKRSADLTSGKINDAAQLSSSSSLADEAQSSQSSTGVDLYRTVSYDHARQMASEISQKSLSTLDNEKRVQENLIGEQGSTGAKEFVEKQPLLEDAQLSKSGDSHSSSNTNIDGSDKVGLSANATAYAPSRGSSKTNEKPSSPGEQPELPVASEAPGDSQPTSSRGRPRSSASSNSDCAVAASASSAPGLSPSSSVSSLSSERSTLNPHAKEFKLNPNAKSFIPSQSSTRPQSPVTEVPFYNPPNVSTVPHMHGMGFGIGHTFVGHQPVIYNPQVPMQSPQAYYHPHGLQYGQQMVVGQTRPIFYVPSYQPEMPYKGRDF